MEDGGGVVRFDGKDVRRCYSVSFDYDRWEYRVNNEDAKALPDKLKSLAVVVEKG